MKLGTNGRIRWLLAPLQASNNDKIPKNVGFVIIALPFAVRPP